MTPSAKQAKPSIEGYVPNESTLVVLAARSFRLEDALPAVFATAICIASGRGLIFLAFCGLLYYLLLVGFRRSYVVIAVEQGSLVLIKYRLFGANVERRIDKDAIAEVAQGAIYRTSNVLTIRTLFDESIALEFGWAWNRARHMYESVINKTEVAFPEGSSDGPATADALRMIFQGLGISTRQAPLPSYRKFRYWGRTD